MTFESLAERYPDIYFALLFGNVSSEAAFAQLEDADEEIPEEIEVLYIFGLEGRSYRQLRPWLKQDPKRQLIIFEDHLDVFASWIKCEFSSSIIKDSQIELRYVNDWQEAIAKAARDFPTRHIEVRISKKYAQSRNSFFSDLRLQLLRKTGMLYTYFSEAVHAPLLNTNFIYNAPLLARSFGANQLIFAGVPAIICGAGPSLGAATPLLRTLEDRALIFSGGSAVAALGHLGIVPHIALAIDPNHEEYERFKTNFVQEVPLLYGHRLRHQVFSTFNGPLGYLRSGTGGSGETWLEEKLGITGEEIGSLLGPEALSITTLALATAAYMGCNPIILIGVDLAYLDDKRYAPGVVRDASINTSTLERSTEALERLVQRKNGQGQLTSTHVRWVMEAEVLGEFAKKHSDITFFNASERGLCIPHIPHMSLDTWSESYAATPRDLRGLVHAQAESLRFTSITSEKIQELFAPLVHSLHQLRQFMPQIHEELDRLEREPSTSLDSGKLLALTLQCEEEPAFTPLLDTIGLAYDLLMRRPSLQTAERSEQISFLRAKWSHFEHAISHYLDLFRSEAVTKEN